VLTALVVLGAVVMGRRGAAHPREPRWFGQAWALRAMAEAEWWRHGH
jgi:hypothetical protein